MSDTCFVLGCKSGCKIPENLGRTWQWFTPPFKNQPMMAKWKELCRKPDFKPWHRICHIHFPESMIIKSYTTVLKNGMVCQYDYDRWQLVENAFPTLHLPPRLSTVPLKRTHGEGATAETKLAETAGSLVKTIQNLLKKIESLRLFYSKTVEKDKEGNVPEPIDVDEEIMNSGDVDILGAALSELQRRYKALADECFKVKRSTGVTTGFPKMPIPNKDANNKFEPNKRKADQSIKSEPNTCSFLVDVTSKEPCTYDLVTDNGEPVLALMIENVRSCTGGAGSAANEAEHNYAGGHPQNTSTPLPKGGATSTPKRGASTPSTSRVVAKKVKKIDEDDGADDDDMEGIELDPLFDPQLDAEDVDEDDDDQDFVPSGGGVNGKKPIGSKCARKILTARRMAERWRMKYYRLQKSIEKGKQPKAKGVFIPFKNITANEKKMALAIAERATGPPRNLTGPKFSATQMIESSLLLSKGKMAYDFVRENSLEALPSVRTVQRFRKKLNKGEECTFGLNTQNLEQMNSHLKDEAENKKYIAIKFSEIFLKADPKVQENENQGVNVNEPQLTPGSKRLQTNAMVFTAEFLCDNVSFVIGTYKSNGALKGTEIEEKLKEVIQAIEENCGIVLTVSSNGANPVKLAFKNLGVGFTDGDLTNTVTTLFGCERRPIFFLHDIAYIMKNIRVHFLKTEVDLHFMGQVIHPTYIQRVFELDQDNPTGKMCPKLTKDHFNIKNKLTKKKVSLAIQIFSNSVADGIEYYRDTGDPFMENSESTELFVRWLNELFDALNADGSRNSVMENNIMYQNLEKAYHILNSEEKMTFAAKSTIDCLKMTVQSTLEVCSYLLYECNYQNVLTSKLMNQDKFEAILQM